MKLATSFSVPLPVEDAWKMLLDVERVAGWFPGARLDAVEEDGFKGTVRVKLGPMLVDYRGSARFSHRVVLEAAGREQRGAGTAKAIAATELKAAGGTTEVSVSIDLDVTGRPAQLGQSLMQDVTERLVGEFAARMQADLSQPTPDEDSPTNSDLASPVRQDGDVLDLGQMAGRAMARKAARFVALLFGAVLVWRKLASRSSKRAAFQLRSSIKRQRGLHKGGQDET
jgi:uncharacterized protein